jgi:hypothetical protein
MAASVAHAVQDLVEQIPAEVDAAADAVREAASETSRRAASAAAETARRVAEAADAVRVAALEAAESAVEEARVAAITVAFNTVIPPPPPAPRTRMAVVRRPAEATLGAAVAAPRADRTTTLLPQAHLAASGHLDSARIAVPTATRMLVPARGPLRQLQRLITWARLPRKLPPFRHALLQRAAMWLPRLILWEYSRSPRHPTAAPQLLAFLRQLAPR